MKDNRKLKRARERLKQHNKNFSDVNLGQGFNWGAEAKEGQARYSSSQKLTPVQREAAARNGHQARVQQQTKDQGKVCTNL